VAISVARARQICTKAELDLVLQSTTRQIGQLDAKQLRAAIRRSRTLRDKWRDLSHSQTRDTKATDPDKLGEANARSAEKAELFDDALQRFEKRLTKIDKLPATGSTSVKRPTKSARATDHRAERAVIRDVLSEKKEILNAPVKKSPTQKVATKKTTTAAESAKSVKKASPGSAVAPKTPVKKAAIKKTPVKKAVNKKTPPAKTVRPAAGQNGLAAAAIAAGQANVSDSMTGAEKKRNLKAKTVAKATAVSRSGATRIQGHVSSQGRRNQAKRNSR